MRPSDALTSSEVALALISPGQAQYRSSEPRERCSSPSAAQLAPLFDRNENRYHLGGRTLQMSKRERDILCRLSQDREELLQPGPAKSEPGSSPWGRSVEQIAFDSEMRRPLCSL